MRIHNTKNLILALSQSYDQKLKTKPNGLWYSIDWEWREWCESNMPEKVKPVWWDIIIDEESILIIKSIRNLNAFEKKYKISSDIFSGIDWEKVAKDYKGIEISNFEFLKNKSYESKKWIDRIWFLGFDVSSGCIWDLTAIKEVKKML